MGDNLVRMQDMWADTHFDKMSLCIELNVTAASLIDLRTRWMWGLGWRSRRVPGSIPGHWVFFPGDQTVPCALGSTQPLKVSTRIFLGVNTAGA